MSTHGLVRAVIAGEPRQVVEAEVVVRGGRVAPPRLEQADGVGVGIRPESLLPRAGDRGEVLVEVVVRARPSASAGSPGSRLNSVGMSVEPWMLACPRRAMMPPPGRPMLPKQQLDDRGAADVLHADGVLRPADRVDPAGGALPTAVRGHRLAQLLANCSGLIPQISCDHLRGVPGVVPLEDLEHATADPAASRRAGPRRVRQRRAAAAELVAAPRSDADSSLSPPPRAAASGPRRRRARRSPRTPRARVVRARSRGRSRRTGRRGLRCRRSPR